METRMISCKRFLDSHTAENISVAYKTAVRPFTVQSEIVGIVTDNAAKMVKAFNKPDCVTFWPELPEETDNESEISDDDQQSSSDSADDHENSLIRLTINWESVEEAGDLPDRYPCLTHTLQLVVHDGLQQNSAKLGQVLAKYERFVSSIHKSCTATEILEKEEHCQILSANATRWNSKLHMISAVVKIEKQKSGTLQKVNNELPARISVTDSDIAMLEELEGLLIPFANATVRLQASFF